MDVARGFGGLSIRGNTAEVTGSCSQGARLEESGSPEPFVHAYGGHDLIFNPIPWDGVSQRSSASRIIQSTPQPAPGTCPPPYPPLGLRPRPLRVPISIALAEPEGWVGWR